MKKTCEGCKYPMEVLSEDFAVCRNPGCDLNPYLTEESRQIVAKRKVDLLEREKEDRVRQAGLAASYRGK